MLVKITHNGITFQCSPRQAAALEALMETNGGGFATVKGYVATSGRVSPETADITFVSRFKVSRLYERSIAALEAMKMEDIMSDVRDNPKVKALTVEALWEAFDARKATEIASMQKTLEGDRDDAHRAAHDRNYVTMADGVKVHFKSEKDKTSGLKLPILVDGLPVVESIMLNIIQVSKKVITPGEYKAVNSGVPVLLGNAMHNHLPKSCKIKALSLKEDNFESLHIDGNAIIPNDIKGLFT